MDARYYLFLIIVLLIGFSIGYIYAVGNMVDWVYDKIFTTLKQRGVYVDDIIENEAKVYLFKYRNRIG